MKYNTKEQSESNECLECRRPSHLDVAEFQSAIGMIVGKWKIEIVSTLIDGPLRFGELRRSLPGITQHMLTAHLRELESSGLVLRTAYAEIPPRVVYELTEAAYALKPVFDLLLEWFRRYDKNLDTAGERPKTSSSPRTENC